MFCTNPHKIVPKIVPMMIFSVPMMVCAHDEIRVKNPFLASVKSFYMGTSGGRKCRKTAPDKASRRLCPRAFGVPMVLRLHGHK
jgi:hypothetical protein